MNIAPGNSQFSTVDSVKFGDSAPSAPGLQDILRTQQGPLSIASQVNGRHPLENRLTNWEKSQRELQLEQYRRIFGAAEPIKRSMELKIVDSTDFMPQELGGGTNVHRDILLNKDCSVEWEDIYKGEWSCLFVARSRVTNKCRRQQDGLSH